MGDVQSLPEILKVANEIQQHLKDLLISTKETIRSLEAVKLRQQHTETKPSNFIQCEVEAAPDDGVTSTTQRINATNKTATTNQLSPHVFQFHMNNLKLISKLHKIYLAKNLPRVQRYVYRDLLLGMRIKDKMTTLGGTKWKAVKTFKMKKNDGRCKFGYNSSIPLHVKLLRTYGNIRRISKQLLRKRFTNTHPIN